MNFRIFLLPLLALVLMSSCKTSRMLEALQAHRLNLISASSSDMSVEDKMDVIGNTFAAVLDESLQYTSVKKSVKHIDKFSKQNKKELDMIFADISKSVDGMSKNEKRKFLLGLATKRYTLDIIRLVPKVEKKISRRINTFLFMNKLMKLVKPKNLLGL